ncbi:hypothetical protein Tco_0734565 [Tanacetum coccineum]
MIVLSSGEIQLSRGSSTSSICLLQAGVPIRGGGGGKLMLSMAKIFFGVLMSGVKYEHVVDEYCESCCDSVPSPPFFKSPALKCYSNKRIMGTNMALVIRRVWLINFEIRED